jgi:aspartate/methionine/tyrosine aminotransferase
MIPRPQYPIYSATIEKLGGKKVGYAMDEKKGWSASLEELERSLAEAQKDGIKVNSFVLINPGNPTGQVLTPEAVRDVVKFCSKHNLVLLADEVYQENVYAEKKKFYSCRHAARDAGLDNGKVELVSFHSTSKGLLGECGRRGGYMDMVGFDPLIRDQMYKLASSNLCANVPGQVMTSIMVNGPKKGDVSYEKHEEEKKKIYDGLRKRAKIVGDGFNTIPGISCEPVQGSMYCFPKVDIPAGAIAAAEAQGITPDTLYAVSLLENTGICVVPASGFGQEEGRCGFRTTFLPSEDEMLLVVDKVRKHHGEFCEKYQ